MTNTNDRIVDTAAYQDAADVDLTATPDSIVINLVSVSNPSGAAAATAATAATTATLKAVGSQMPPSRRPSFTPAGIPDTDIELVGKDPGTGALVAPTAVPVPAFPTVIASDPAVIPTLGPDLVHDNVPVSPRPRQGQPDASQPVMTYERPLSNIYTATNISSSFQDPIIVHPDTDIDYHARLLAEPGIPNAADMELARYGEVAEALQNDVNSSRSMAELAGSVSQPNMFNRSRASAGGAGGPRADERRIAAGAHLPLPPSRVQVGSYCVPTLAPAPSALAFRDNRVAACFRLCGTARRESRVDMYSRSLVVHTRSAGGRNRRRHH